MAERRTYTKRQKLAAVMAAEMSGLTQASEATGIPLSTIAYWLDRPEFAEVRSRTREALADEIKTVAHLAWQRIGESLRNGTMEPRDAVFAAEKATSLYQLVTGMATQRTESRDISGTLSDADLIDAIREAERLAGEGRTPAPATEPPEG